MCNTQLEAAVSPSSCKWHFAPHPHLQCSRPTPSGAIRTPDFAMTPAAHPYLSITALRAGARESFTCEPALWSGAELTWPWAGCTWPGVPECVCAGGEAVVGWGQWGHRGDRGGLGGTLEPGCREGWGYTGAGSSAQQHWGWRGEGAYRDTYLCAQSCAALSHTHTHTPGLTPCHHMLTQTPGLGSLPLLDEGCAQTDPQPFWDAPCLRAKHAFSRVGIREPRYLRHSELFHHSSMSWVWKAPQD